MKQIDYIKIKVPNTGTLDTTHLTEHSTIKNRYHINFPKNGFNGTTPFNKHIEVYQSQDAVYVKCSLPYLVHGHNHIDFSSSEAMEILVYISGLLKIDLLGATVVDFEVGYIHRSRLPFKELCHTISGIHGMELNKKTSSFIGYGHKNTQFKLYNVYKNLQRKVSKVVFDSIENIWTSHVKVELKITKDNRYTVSEFLQYGYLQAFAELDDVLHHRIQQVGHSYHGIKFDDILYMTLLNANKYTYKNVDEMILDTIDTIDATPSQKTARRVALRNKQAQIKHNQSMCFLDYLEDPRCDDLPF